MTFFFFFGHIRRVGSEALSLHFFIGRRSVLLLNLHIVETSRQLPSELNEWRADYFDNAA